MLNVIGNRKLWQVVLLPGSFYYRRDSKHSDRVRVQREVQQDHHVCEECSSFGVSGVKHPPFFGIPPKIDGGRRRIRIFQWQHDDPPSSLFRVNLDMLTHIVGIWDKKAHKENSQRDSSTVAKCGVPRYHRRCQEVPLHP